jgi:hypothetical protein
VESSINGKQYVWASTEGLSTARSGTVTVPPGGGSVTATYEESIQGGLTEGDYSEWAFSWKRYYGGDGYKAPTPNQIYVLESQDRVILFDAYYGNVQTLRLSDGTLLEEGKFLIYDNHDHLVPSVLNKYVAIVVNEDNMPKLRVYKDGQIIQIINLYDQLGWDRTSSNYCTVFSKDGKYLFVSILGYPYEYAIFVAEG